MVPASTVPIAEAAEARKVLRLLDLLDDNDDVQDVYANFDIPEELLVEARGRLSSHDGLASAVAATPTASLNTCSGARRRTVRAGEELAR